ncbi:hypothetical protein AAEX28_06710 [Lentisphaerota bacterium WC36G]|nr:hypothetical protein LJT99_09575 [Lentisphaerae bacterium WC36]
MKNKIVIFTILIVFLLAICSYFMCEKNRLKTFSYKNLRIAPYLNLVDEYAEKNKLIEKKYILKRVRLVSYETVKGLLLKVYNYKLDEKKKHSGFVIITLSSTQAEYGDIVLLADYKKCKIIKKILFKPKNNSLKVTKDLFHLKAKITTSFREILYNVINKKVKSNPIYNYEELTNCVKGIAFIDRYNAEAFKLNGSGEDFILVDVSERPTWKDLNDSMLGGVLYLFFDASTHKFIKSFIVK